MVSQPTTVPHEDAPWNSPPSAPWQLWVDGTARPNPGKIAIGCHLLGPDGQTFTVSRLTGTSGCNNTAEILALCEGLALAARHGAQALQIFSDSDLTVSHLNQPPRSAHPRLAPLLQQAASLLAPFTHAVLEWIPRHRNSAADTLARSALGLPPKISAPLAPHKKRRR